MQGSSHPVIAIDGPSGAGKSTVAKRLAHALHYCYVDSGALYRAVGWMVQAQGLAVQDTTAIVAALEQAALAVTFCAGASQVWLQGQCVTPHLYGEAVGALASAVGTLPGVRSLLTAQLRQLRCQAALVMEGRDIGTVVFPDATVKFFLQASLNARGQRRFHEMQRSGQRMPLEEVLQALARRDGLDQTRTAAPLVQAVDAYVIDTTDLTVDAVVQTMLSEIQRCIPPEE